MALNDTIRKELWANFMSEASARREEITATKQDLRDAVDAVDDWVEANIALFNLAIPQPTRTALTVRQKVELLLYVIKKRWEVS